MTTAHNPPPNERQVLIAPGQHFDILWRKPLQYYRDTQAAVIRRVLDIVDEFPEFRFSLHQANVLRHFIDKHPQHAPRLKQCVANGAVEIVGGMETIPDTNMVCGESLVRNILYGKQWVRSTFGIEPRIGSLLDAFGSSGQLPQIFAGTSHDALLPGRVPGVKLTPRFGCPPFLWTGIDGTVIKAINFSLDGISIDTMNTWYGWGVMEGFDKRYASETITEAQVTSDVHHTLQAATADENPHRHTLLVLYGEEHLPRREVALAVRSFKSNGTSVRFGHMADFLDSVDWNGSIEQVRGDCNAEFTGCYTTRIELKQANQRTEVALYNAELLHALAALQGSMPPDAQALKEPWRKLFVCQFHDALCGCHIDENYHHITTCFAQARSAANQQIDAYLQPAPTNDASTAPTFIQVTNTLPFNRRDVARVHTTARCAVNASGRPIPCQRDGDDLLILVDLPACGCKGYAFSDKDATAVSDDATQMPPESLRIPTASIGTFNLRQSPLGFAVTDATHSRDILVNAAVPAQIVLRQDTGTLWTENFTGLEWREPAAGSTLSAIEDGDLFLKLTYHGSVSAKHVGWDSFEHLDWVKTFYVHKHLPRIDISIDLNYVGQGTEISTLFATDLAAEQAQARYEIPFGSIAREAYPPSRYPYARGNWPALSWCDYRDDRWGVTFVHRGTPGCLAHDGRVSFSLLRSATSYSEPLFPARPEPLSFDNGPHRFEFTLIPHAADNNTWIQYARGFVVEPLTHQTNTPIDPLRTEPALAIDAPNVALSALKPAENGVDLILRLFETIGLPIITAVRLASGSRLAEPIETSMDEQHDGPRVNLDEVSLRPFEVKTIRLRLNHA
jgi:alpha-mannosidase